MIFAEHFQKLRVPVGFTCGELQHYYLFKIDDGLEKYVALEKYIIYQLTHSEYQQTFQISTKYQQNFRSAFFFEKLSPLKSYEEKK